MKTAPDSARAYLDKLPAAIAGAGGHAATFAAACWTVRLGLSDSDALALLLEYNRRCLPPWTEKELAHKLQDARRVAGGQVRTFEQPKPAARLVWKIERKATPAKPVKPLPVPPAAPSDILSGVWIVRPGEPIPAQFVDVLRTWAAIRQHPAWKGHPQLA